MLPDNIEREIKKLAKVELHCHLDGSLSAKTLYSFFNEEQKARIDFQNFCHQVMVSKDCHKLADYLACFKLPLELLSTKKRLELAVLDLANEMAGENVVYAELRYAPQMLKSKELQTSHEIVETVCKAGKRAEQLFGVKLRFILCLMRGHSNLKDEDELISLAEEFRNEGVVALDLVGDEAAHPLKNYIAFFEKVKNKDLAFTIHAGETGSHEEVWLACELGAKRIGHGIASVKDKKLMAYLQEHNIHLEICPTSNIQTGACENYAAHPLHIFYQKGLSFSVNTDNRLVSNTSLSAEWQAIKNSNPSLSMQDILQINRDSFKHIFLNDEERRDLAFLVD